jgi:propanol-preferring alcohol dehydrogenase
MKALLLDKPGPVDSRPLRLVEIPVPNYGPTDVLIKVSACGICRTDLHVVEGELAPRLSPVIPGHQVVGVVEAVGEEVAGVECDERVGVAWLNRTCGICKFCTHGKENLCESPEFTGWTRNGGFAQYITAPAAFVYPIPAGFSDLEAAPLLCAGIIGYRALRLTNIYEWAGARVGIYGFGAAGHVCIQIARNRGAEVFVATRDRKRHQALADELGAAWVGDTFDRPPGELDAAIIFAPAGEIVPAALDALTKGGTLVLGGIYMSNIPELRYQAIYGERMIRSVSNNTRDDGRAFLDEAAAIPVKTSVQQFPLENANEALIALRNDAIKGAGVLTAA